MHRTCKASIRELKKLLLGCVLPMGMLAASPVQAQSTDLMIEGAKHCTRQLPRYERQYGIPTHLLSAIASTESGRYHKGLNIKVPWPWTINADGAGYYLDSKSEAIAMVRKLQSRGVKSIDVGCMQVNLMHHPMAFGSLEEAFDPEHNVAYAASFLRSIYQEESSWKKAAAFYHSRTPSRGGEYVGHVYNSWYSIVDKLRMAQVEVPSSSLTAMNDMKRSVGDTSSFTSSGRPYGSNSVIVAGQKQSTSAYSRPSAMKVARLPEQKGQKVSAYRSPRMNSIQVTNADDRRRNGIMVVTPDIKVVDADGKRTASNIPVSNAAIRAPKTITVAQVSPTSSPVAYATNAAPTITSAVQAAQQSPSAGGMVVATGKRPGPSFIFND
jgi:hypothetical protein